MKVTQYIDNRVTAVHVCTRQIDRQTDRHITLLCIEGIAP